MCSLAGSGLSRFACFPRTLVVHGAVSLNFGSAIATIHGAFEPSNVTDCICSAITTHSAVVRIAVTLCPMGPVAAFN